MNGQTARLIHQVSRARNDLNPNVSTFQSSLKREWRGSTYKERTSLRRKWKREVDAWNEKRKK